MSSIASTLPLPLQRRSTTCASAAPAELHAPCRNRIRRPVSETGNSWLPDERLLEYTDRLRCVAQRLLNSAEHAADAVQDALLQAFAARHSFAGHSSIYTWLYRIVVNVCLSQLRSRRAKLVSLESDEQWADASRNSRLASTEPESADAGLQRDELQEFVRAGIDRLPADYREILLLRDIYELDTEQTAEVLGVSVAAVKTRLHRARQALRAELSSECHLYQV